MEQAPWFIVLCVIGFFVGVPMGLAYSLGVPMGLAYSLGVTYACVVAACVTGFIIGIVKRKKIVGKALIILTLIGWTFLGLIGLSTGT